MEQLLLHPKTLRHCKQVITNTPHAVLIAGLAGSGKESTARALAESVLGLKKGSLGNYAYFQEINPKEDSISIDEIRSLQQFLRLKVPATNHKPIQRLVLIHEAGRMRAEAQNALLKTLEEPPLDTMLILTAESPEQLLTTITSRTTLLPILPVSHSQALSYFEHLGKKPAAISKFYALSQGQVGLLSALLHDESHPLLEQVELAKSILAKPVGERLLLVDELSKDKANVKLLLNALSRISHAALTNASTKNSFGAAKKWHQTQSAVIDAINSLKSNPNTKLLLDNLFLSI